MKLALTQLGPIIQSVAAAAALRHASAEAAARREGPPIPRNGRQAFVDALRAPGLSLLAEHKRRAPSAGVLCTEDALERIVTAYADSGAAAVSILTEEAHFGGCLQDLARAAAVAPKLPRLRKDFLLDFAMVAESVAAGADAILLLAVVHEPSALAELTAAAQEQDLAVLCEVHDEEELEAALVAAPDAIGINARDLRDFTIDLGQVERLLPQVPSSVVRVAESGLQELADFRRMQHAGADAALVGTTLMRHPERLAAWVRSLS